MAPMTRSRANPDGVPNKSAAIYYAQRASIGLIISEAAQPSEDGQGYMATPGIYTDAHITGWRAVTDAVHAEGGHMFIQLMHTGRISHPDNTPHHRCGVAPSAIAPDSPIFTPTGMQPTPVPRELSIKEIEQTIEDFRHAARHAIEAGADGVEIHGANGYLIQQFISPNANTRTDIYGGAIENRARFAIQVASAIAQEIGSDRTAIRLSPGSITSGIDEGPESDELYRYLITELDKQGLAYLHLVITDNETLLAQLRQIWHSNLILNRPSRPRDKIGADIASGLADLESYGQLVLANPDFVERLKSGTAMNQADPRTFFGGADEGYINYPTLRQTAT
jgi:2,4-dienoyl-CoA reductase-like NADH-dependent reductase (Old Yellow Enzyme family)